MFAIDYAFAKERLGAYKEKLEPLAVVRRDGRNLLILSDEMVDMLGDVIKDHLIRIEEVSLKRSAV